MLKPTIYEALRNRLTREPTKEEVKVEVERILEEGRRERLARDQQLLTEFFETFNL